MTSTARDGLRFSLLRLASKGQDIKFSEERVPESRNFGNKLWNAARFVLMNIEGEIPRSETAAIALPERWILSRLQQTIRAVDAGLAGYDMDDACSALYEFLWSEYCDSFVELCKPALQGPDGPAKDSAAGDASQRTGCHRAPAAPVHAVCDRGHLAEPAASKRRSTRQHLRGPVAGSQRNAD